jgi:hypothetical protein
MEQFENGEIGTAELTARLTWLLATLGKLPGVISHVGEATGEANTAASGTTPSQSRTTGNTGGAAVPGTSAPAPGLAGLDASLTHIGLPETGSGVTAKLALQGVADVLIPLNEQMNMLVPNLEKGGNFLENYKTAIAEFPMENLQTMMELWKAIAESMLSIAANSEAIMEATSGGSTAPEEGEDVESGGNRRFGGRVPGYPGEPRLVLAHGGEEFSGIGGGRERVLPSGNVFNFYGYDGYNRRRLRAVVSDAYRGVQEDARLKRLGHR